MIFKFDDKNDCVDKRVYAFKKLDLKNKVSFPMNNYPDSKSIIQVKGAK